MKQLFARTLTFFVVVVVWLMGSAQAQSTPWVIKVHIPFAFSVGDQTFPEGNYSLVQPLQHFLVLRDARGQAIASTFTSGIESSNTSATSKLRFESVGGLNVLSEVWQQNSSSGQKLFAAKGSVTFVKRRSPEARAAAEGSQP